MKVSYRLARIAELIERQIALLINQELNHPRIVGTGLTITRTKLAPDLRLAYIYFTRFNETPENIQDVRQALNHSANFLRRRLSETLSLRYVPTLKFYYDEELRKSQRVMQLIDQLSQ